MVYPPRMVLRTATEANVRWSEATAARFGLPTEGSIWQTYKDTAAELIRAQPDGAVVLDLGGGRSCIYAKDVVPPGRIRIIAVDISSQELALNTDVAETRVADVAKQLPMPDASADLIMSRALLEHVADVPAAIREMARVLRPGGTTLHLVPCRYSIFGTAARLLPFGPLLRLTYKLAPWYRNYSFGFKVYYDRCFPSALESEFRAAGFAAVETQVCWACDNFFRGVYPVYVLHACYEQILRRLKIKRLAAYTIVKAVR